MIRLRKIHNSDKKYFAAWWRNPEMQKVTSGVMRRISDSEVDKYFARIANDEKGIQRLITFNGKAIGHAALESLGRDRYEMRIIIGARKDQDRGHGTTAIRQMVAKAEAEGIDKIRLEVRPDNARAIRAYEKCGFMKTEIKKYPTNKNLPETIVMVYKKD